MPGIQQIGTQHRHRRLIVHLPRRRRALRAANRENLSIRPTILELRADIGRHAVNAISMRSRAGENLSEADSVRRVGSLGRLIRVLGTEEWFLADSALEDARRKGRGRIELEKGGLRDLICRYQPCEHMIILEELRYRAFVNDIVCFRLPGIPAFPLTVQVFRLR